MNGALLLWLLPLLAVLLRSRRVNELSCSKNFDGCLLDCVGDNWVGFYV